MSSRVVKKVGKEKAAKIESLEASAEAQQDKPVHYAHGLRILLNNTENGPVIRKLIITTIMMFTLPFIAFYGFKYLDYGGFPLLHMWLRDRDLVGMIGAGIVIQLIIGVYIYIAFTEKDDRIEAWNEKHKTD